MSEEFSMELEEYKDMVEKASDIIQSVTSDGSLKYVNEAWTSILGYSRDEAASMKIFDIIHPDELKHCKEMFVQVMAGEDLGLVTTRFVTKTGQTVYVEGNVNCHFDNGNPVYTRAIFRDITRLVETETVVKRLYDREKKLREDLEEEIRKRSEFSRILVHELKTPLTSIMGLVELLQLSEQQPPYDRAINSLNRSAAELNDRISELLELTRAEIGKLAINPGRIDPSSLLTEVVTDFQLIAEGKQIHLNWDIPSNLPSVNADGKRLRQVVQNILDNAVKATPEHGEIAVKASTDKDFLIVQVSDTGHGISKKDLANIFEPYFRVDGSVSGYEGMGLGLTLSRRIVELHEGSIQVESEPGKGSTFSIVIPLTQG